MPKYFITSVTPDLFEKGLPGLQNFVLLSLEHSKKSNLGFHVPAGKEFNGTKEKLIFALSKENSNYIALEYLISEPGNIIPIRLYGQKLSTGAIISKGTHGFFAEIDCIDNNEQPYQYFITPNLSRDAFKNKEELQTISLKYLNEKLNDDFPGGAIFYDHIAAHSNLLRHSVDVVMLKYSLTKEGITIDKMYSYGFPDNLCKLSEISCVNAPKINLNMQNNH